MQLNYSETNKRVILLICFLFFHKKYNEIRLIQYLNIICLNNI